MRRELNFAIGAFLGNAVVVSRSVLKLGLLKLLLLLQLLLLLSLVVRQSTIGAAPPVESSSSSLVFAELGAD